MGPRRPVTEPGSPEGSGARAAGCAAAGAAVRSQGSSWEAPAAFAPHGPLPEAASATHPAGRSLGPLAVVIAARAGRQAQPRCCGRIPATRRPGRGAPGGGEGDGAGPVSGCPPAQWGHGRARAAHCPPLGAGQVGPRRSRSAQTPSGAANTERSCRHLHPLGLGNSPPSLGLSSWPRT